MTRFKLIPLVMLPLLATSLVWAAGFDHDAHVRDYVDGGDCSVCHLADAPSIVPDPAVCLDCHDSATIDALTWRGPTTHGPLWALNHRSEAKGEAIDCMACHRQADCLDCHKAGFSHEQGDFGNSLTNVHRSDFHVTHPIAARTDQRLCASCHEPGYCADCHDQFRLRGDSLGSPSHRRTFDLGFGDTDIDAIHAGMDPSITCDSCHLQGSIAPDYHSWSIGHAREARRSLSSCQACHPDGDVCLRCHSARAGAGGYNPHPKDWGDIKDNLRKASNGKTCRRCH